MAVTGTPIAPQEYQLITVDRLKLLVPSLADVDDSVLSLFISQATDMIEKELGTTVLSRDHSEFHSGGSKWVIPDHFPITSVSRICVGSQVGMYCTYSGSAVRATVEVTGTEVTLRTTTAGVESATTLRFDDYASVGLIANAIGNLTGWSVDVDSSYSEYASSDLIQQPARSAKDYAVPLNLPADFWGEYEITEDARRIYNPFGWLPGTRNIRVDYRAGYDVVPEAIESACAELVQLMYNSALHDLAISSEKIGDYSYSVGKLGALFSTEHREAVSNLVSTKLAPYQRISIG